MSQPTSPIVWLAYVSYPVTTAVYLERALRRTSRVVTCGPKIGPEIIQQWQLQNMKLPVLDHDFPLPFQPDMREVCAAARDRFPPPDLYLWIESVPGHFPQHLEALKCPKACYLIDSHLNLEWHVKWAPLFDFVFVAQREYIPEFRRHGCAQVHWLPLACDPEIHARKDTQKHFDVGFVGSIFANSRRAQLLMRLAEKNFLVKIERCFWDEMARLFSQSRMVFNNSARNDLNMRVFETLSIGSFLLTDFARNSGQDELFVAGEDFDVYEDDQLLAKVRHYLVHEELREAIARRGQTMVHQAHTYAHRCEALINVCLRSGKGTPTAGEWRERSLAGLPAKLEGSSVQPHFPQGRSFVIPVLNASEKGRAEFEALLRDLGRVEGEVIVIFNSPEAAVAFKEHPRIDLSASLNINAGVARAWNIGVHLATQPTLFFLNADLRFEPEVVHALEQALWSLPAAAIVGPQGSFFGFYTYEDILFFDKGQAQAAQEVDAVSGFFFGAKRELFSRKVLQFENAYTPCFAEEWDLGLQARKAGYRSYIVPVTAYKHEFGISAQPDKVVRYGKNDQARAGEILARNRIRFWRKWLSDAGELAVPPWEPNPPARPSSGAALLQSRVIELTGRSAPIPEIEIQTIESGDLLPSILNFLGLVGEGVKVGVKAGNHSEFILSSWQGKRLYSIDAWTEPGTGDNVDSAGAGQPPQENLFRQATLRLSPYHERSVIVRKTSAEAVRDFSDRTLDFVYLDAQREDAAIRDDIRIWSAKVKRGGILCGNDYRDAADSRGGGGVKSAVNEFCREGGIRRIIIGKTDASWFVRIP